MEFYSALPSGCIWIKHNSLTCTRSAEQDLFALAATLSFPGRAPFGFGEPLIRFVHFASDNLRRGRGRRGWWWFCLHRHFLRRELLRELLVRRLVLRRVVDVHHRLRTLLKNCIGHEEIGGERKHEAEGSTTRSLGRSGWQESWSGKGDRQLEQQSG